MQISEVRKLVSDLVMEPSMTSWGFVAKIWVTSATAHGAKQITTGCSNALKAAYSDSIDRNTASRILVLKWTLYAASACRLSGIAPDVVRREGY